MKKLTKIVLFFLANLRFLIGYRYGGLIAGPINLYYFIKLHLKGGKDKPLVKDISFNDFKKIVDEGDVELQQLRALKKKFGYVPDPSLGEIDGFFDYDSTLIGIYMRGGGDCDDYAYLASRTIKKAKPIKGYRISMCDLKEGSTSLHVDYYYELNNTYYLADYGSPISGTSLPDCLNTLCKRWYSKYPEKVISVRMLY